MKAKKSLLAVMVFLCLLSSSGFASATTYTFYAQGGDGNWHDANKIYPVSLKNGDYSLCWAAAASNILDWAGWGTTALNNQTSIFNYFTEHWTDKGSLPEYGWRWWLNGTLPDNVAGWAQVDVSGGNFWPGANYNSFYHEAWGGNVMSSVNSFLHSGYGVTLAIYPITGSGGHALTCWGYDYSSGAYGYSGVWVTDSDDGVTQLQYYGVSWNAAKQEWDLQGGFLGWYIGGVEALGLNPVPLPPTLLLFGSGLLGLVAWRRYGKG
jgi:hypothetical protein